MIVFLNGKLIPESRAFLSIHDHGFLYGDGVYETLFLQEGKIFHLSEHLARLSKSLRGISLKSPMSMEKLARVVAQTARANRHLQAAVRITITRGVGGPGFDPSTCPAATVLVTSRPFSGYPARFYQRGLTAAVVNVRRNSPASTPPWIKSTSCLNNVWAKMEARKLKAHEAIMLAENGHVAEGASSNVFAVKHGRLWTPALDGTQLPGVTRGVVLGLARKEGIGVHEVKMSVRQLVAADEIFLTSSLMGVMPVGKIIVDGRTRVLGNGRIGPITRRMMICYTSPRCKSTRSGGII